MQTFLMDSKECFGIGLHETTERVAKGHEWEKAVSVNSQILQRAEILNGGKAVRSHQDSDLENPAKKIAQRAWQGMPCTILIFGMAKRPASDNDGPLGR